MCFLFNFAACIAELAAKIWWCFDPHRGARRVGETRVDLLHLLEDLRDAYPGSLEETILTEIVANALDAGATTIAFATSHAAATLTVVDNGRGMSRADLRRFHDLAISTKQRGRGIGFAGVGIKLGLLACESVTTESRSGKSHIATAWRLHSRHRAPWQWIPPPGLTTETGTAVQLVISNALSEILDEGFIENTLRHHFQPLFEPDFAQLLANAYPRGIRFTLNGRDVVHAGAPNARVPVVVRLPRKRKPAAAGYVFRADAALPEHERGIAISTLGKVIKRGWDWLGFSPVGADRIAGLIDVPALAECLTLNKADFLRTGPRGATYLAYRKAIQEALAAPLTAWGEGHDTPEDAKRRKARPLERDLREVLAALAGKFPLLDALTDRRPGGQRRLALDGGDGSDGALPLLHLDTAETGAPDSERNSPPPSAPDDDAAAHAEVELGAPPRKQRAHLGLRIDFERREDDPALGRLLESTIWVNEAHPAYQRAMVSRLQAYHLAVTVAMTLAPLAVEPAAVHRFIAAFLERWGAVESRRS